MLEVTDLRKSFGAREALKSVSFTLTPGEIYGLLGPNGAGKTTTLKILAGLLAADGGSVTVEGETYHRENHELKKRIAYVPDQPFLYYKLTGEEHLNFFMDLYRVPYARRRERCDFYFRYFEFEEYRSELVENYSAGTRQKLLISQALAVEPKLLLLDEPLVSIDFNGNPLSSIVDAQSTKVMDGNMVKILSWYDNESGFSHRLIDLMRLVAR